MGIKGIPIYRFPWMHIVVLIAVLLIRIRSPGGPTPTSPILVSGWEWSDYVVSTWTRNIKLSATSSGTTTLSIQDVSDMRVRDIKRRLSRIHGYSAEELSKILDKKELVQALAFEEEKIRLQQENGAKRIVLQQGIIAAIVTILILLCWPVLTHAYEVAMVNLVVYTDRKKVEGLKCFELQCYLGLLGVICMGLLDMLQIWLTASVLLSWVTTSKYFFPIPRLTIRPAQLMGGEMANSSMANYGINVGSMLVTYGLRFLYGKIEQYTGAVLANKARQQRREARQRESSDEKAARKASRKAMKLESLYRQQYQAAMSASMRQPVPPPPPEWLAAASSHGTNDISTKIANGPSHEEFLLELQEHLLPDNISDENPATLDDLD
jgi:hypothetical protein